MNSCSIHNNVTGIQDGMISKVINTLNMSGSTTLDKNFKNEGGEITRSINKFKIFECSVKIALNQFGYRIKINV